MYPICVIAVLIFMLFGCTLAFASGLAARDHPADAAALRALFVATGGPAGAWTNSSNWASNETVCSYFGIVCQANCTPNVGSASSITGDGDGSTCRVVEIRLDENGLNGTLPPELGDLGALTALRLADNSISGTFPEEISTLSRLSYVRVSGNLLSGSLPASLGRLASLIYLELSSNAFNSTIPAELGALSRLLFLDLNSNAQLGGSIPRALGRLTALQYLDLSGCALTGAIPLELSALGDLELLRLDGNALTGTLAFLRAPLAPSVCNLADNAFSGVLPPLPHRRDGGAIAILDLSTAAADGGDGGGGRAVTRLDCPLPDYSQQETLLLHLPCVPQYRSLVIGCAAVVGLVALCVAIWCAARHRAAACVRDRRFCLHCTSFVAAWLLQVAVTVSDASALRVMLAYLSTTIDECAAVNRFAVWHALMAAHLDERPPAGPSVAAPTFTVWTREWMDYFASPNATVAQPVDWIPRNIAAIAAPCVGIHAGCAMRATALLPPQWATECYLADASRAPFGGSAHAGFFAVVLAVAAVRACVELARVAATVHACCAGPPSDDEPEAEADGIPLLHSQTHAAKAVDPAISMGAGGGARTSANSAGVLVDMGAGASAGAGARTSLLGNRIDDGDSQPASAPPKSGWLLGAVRASAVGPPLLLLSPYWSLAAFSRRVVAHSVSHADVVRRAVLQGMLCSLPLLACNLYFFASVLQVRAELSAPSIVSVLLPLSATI